MKENADALSPEEAMLLKDFESGNAKKIPTPAGLQAAARETMRKNKNVNIRNSEMDLQQIRIKASREDLPYQTLIGSVLHKHASGRLKEVD